MKISVITPTFNSEKVISQNIKSVLLQKYDQFKHIIVDNLSEDKTINIVSDIYKSAGEIDKVKIISEKDTGIADAFNKGIKSSTGEIVTILNSDDFYCSDSVFDNIINALKRNDILFVHGDIFFYDPTYGSNLRKPLLCHVQKAMPFNHPTMFFRKEVYDNYGLFDTDFKYAMDFEFICRLTKILGDLNECSAYVRNSALVQMNAGGESWKNELKTIEETKLALQKHDLWNLTAAGHFYLRKFRTKLKNILKSTRSEKVVSMWRDKKWKN
jgi:glycosyltransferase